PFLTADASGPKHMNIKMTRAKLESLCEDLLLRSFEPVKKCLADASKKPSDIDEVVLVGGQTRMPRIRDEVKKYFGKEAHMGVNPDEVVAAGAAVQGGVLTGEVKDMLLLDVTPLSLGIETLGGVMTRLIERNTTIPTRKSQVFSTAADSQTSVEVHVVQGEREMARDNRTLGRFHLDGIPPAPRGVPQVEVTFDIDANGIVHVAAKDKATSKEQKISITSSSGLSKEEIEKMVKDAASHESEDKKKREEIETKNRAEALVHDVDKNLKEHKDKLQAADVTAIESALEELKKAIESTDTEKIKTSMSALEQASFKIGEAMYKAASAAGEAQPGATPGGGDGKEPPKKDENVVDAEFEEAK
ncbi:MAG: Hsp70 family protein, partial [Deltaproteobacteria bacterium]|nr:Hsp70 family protein [Deltaproteobacteria bacterium]